MKAMKHDSRDTLMIFRRRAVVLPPETRPLCIRLLGVRLL